MKSKYKISKTSIATALSIGMAGWVIAIFSSPQGFKLDNVVIILVTIFIYILADLIWGTHVSIENEFLIRTDNFFIRRKISIMDIDMVRYQPTYGIGKEASSLSIFKMNQDQPVLTMTSLWFGEEQICRLASEIKKINNKIKFDDEARNLIGEEVK